MPTQCSAIGCSNRFDPEAKKRGISFHKVPSDPERREAWKRALRRDFVITKHTVICSDHFEEKDLDRTGQTNRLRDGVTPSIFNFPDQDQDDPDQLRRSRRSRKKTKKGEVYKSAVKKKKFVRKIFLPEEPVAPRTGVQKARKSINASKRRSVKEELIESVLTATEPAPPAPAAAPVAAPAAPAAAPAAAAPPALCADDHHYAIDPCNVKQKLDEAHARIEELQKELRNYKDRLRRKNAELRTLTVGIEKQNALMGQLMEGSELWVLCDKCSSKD